ncbi:hypothetical protein [Halovivax cerinus]|uniref:Uncharacterized protein n=1 Tax=Halovivax cerinus TaxID=1487865 RepID=A0ABD5NLH8_9EURY|nr:hypothetical protein [Halovivax cerinus]
MTADLPDPEAGVTVLDSDDPITPFHSPVVDHLPLRTLARLGRLAREHEYPPLITRAPDDAVSEAVSETTSRTVRYRSTPLGPRFESEDVETHVYPQEDGWMQTTPVCWGEVVRAREPLYAGASTEVRTSGAH